MRRHRRASGRRFGTVSRVFLLRVSKSAAAETWPAGLSDLTAEIAKTLMRGSLGRVMVVAPWDGEVVLEDVAVLVEGQAVVLGAGVVIVRGVPGDLGGLGVAGGHADDVGAAPGVVRIGSVAGPLAVIPLADVSEPVLSVQREFQRRV